MLLLAIPALIILGLSQLYATHLWQRYYARLGVLGCNGVRLNGLVSLLLGGLIVAFHNVWSGPPILLTMMGWLLLVESALCLVVPNAGLAGLVEMDHEVRGRIVKGTGVALIIVGGVLGIHLLTAVA